MLTEELMTSNIFNTKLYQNLYHRLQELPDNTLNDSIVSYGAVIRIRGNSLVVKIPKVAIETLCYIYSQKRVITGIVTGFNEMHATVATFDDLKDVSIGDEVVTDHKSIQVDYCKVKFGKLLDSLGNLQSCTLHNQTKAIKVAKLPENKFICTGFNYSDGENGALLSQRKSINTVFETKIPILDRYLKIGKGQRLGIFAKAGLGKSYLIKELLKNANYDYVVVGLIGERGREVHEFLELVNELNLNERLVLIAETSEKSALRRYYAAKTATQYARVLQSQGKDVLLIIDSLTRVARAIRDYSIEAGELPVQRGLTASVFRELPKLIEKCGNFESGSITAFYTVLLEDSQNDLLANELKSLLDGHLILTDEARNEGFLPPIDPIESISRLQLELCSTKEKQEVGFIRYFYSKLRNSKDIISFGGVPDEELKLFLEYERRMLKYLTDINFREDVIDSLINFVK